MKMTEKLQILFDVTGPFKAGKKREHNLFLALPTGKQESINKRAIVRCQSYKLNISPVTKLH